MKTKDWKSPKEALALIIGHDPRLHSSNTTAEYVFFADCYFKTPPTKSSEKRKYGLAKSVYDQIFYITNNSIDSEQIYITNLCNANLPHATRSETVLIPEIEAIKGLVNIKKILLDNPSIKYIFPMSQQVNYWLQKLGLYRGNDDFLSSAEPLEAGVNSIPPYYKPKKGKTFLNVCGNIYKVEGGEQIVIPTLHSKNFPIKGNFIAYEKCYENMREYFKVKVALQNTHIDLNVKAVDVYDLKGKYM